MHRTHIVKEGRQSYDDLLDTTESTDSIQTLFIEGQMICNLFGGLINIQEVYIPVHMATEVEAHSDPEG